MSPDQSQSLLTWVGTGLLHATLLALLTWLLTSTLLRRCRPGIKVLLWGVVLLKFLLPPVFPLPGEVAFSHWVSQIEVADPLARFSGPEAGPQQPLNLYYAQPVSKTQAPQPAGTSSWWSLLLAAYLAGVSALTLRAGVSAYRFRRWLACLPTAEGRLVEQVGQAVQRLKLRRAPQVRLSEDGTSPLVAGLLRPQLVLPRRLLDQLESRAREALLIHELAHIRRGDLWLRALRNLARLLLFFWPPVWWVCQRLERASEMACDHWALALSGVSPSTYARTLLLAAKSAGGANPGLRQLAFASRRRPLEERFDMILKQKNWTLPRISWLSLLLLAAWTAFAWAGTAAAPQQEQEKEKPRFKVLSRATYEAQQVEEKAARAYFRHSDGGAKYLIELASSNPEADLDSDGSISKEEFQAFFDEKQRVRKMEVLQDYPESDLNYDGELSDQELKVFDMEQQVLEAKESLREDPDHPVNFRFSRTPSFRLKRDNVITASDAEIHLKGANFFYEKATEGRDVHQGKASLERLLKEHPEADLDGDGSISAKEAKALVARLQKEKTGVTIRRKDNQ